MKNSKGRKSVHDESLTKTSSMLISIDTSAIDSASIQLYLIYNLFSGKNNFE